VFGKHRPSQRSINAGVSIETPDMLPFCRWLEQTSVGAGVRESLWLFPAIETVHLLGMAALVGTITVFDLRLLGWMLRRERVSDLARRLLPWSWAGFALQVVTGGLLFTSEAIKVYTNPAFRVKMLLIFLAGLHALIFHWMTARFCLRGRRLRVWFRFCYGLELSRQDDLSDSCDFAALAPPIARLTNCVFSSRRPCPPMCGTLSQTL